MPFYSGDLNSISFQSDNNNNGLIFFLAPFYLSNDSWLRMKVFCPVLRDNMSCVGDLRATYTQEQQQLGCVTEQSTAEMSPLNKNAFACITNIYVCRVYVCIN